MCPKLWIVTNPVLPALPASATTHPTHRCQTRHFNKDGDHVAAARNMAHISAAWRRAKDALAAADAAAAHLNANAAS